MSTVIIALDLGTTGNRAIAFNQEGNPVSSSYYEFEQHFPKPGWVEHDPETIWESAYTALKDVVEEVELNNIVSLGITNQRETSIIWNKRTGKPIYNAIVWQCRRTASLCEALSEHSQKIKEKTGLFLDPYFSATKIQWILDTVPDARSLAEKGDLLFGTVDTWILWKLTKGKVHATDTSNASRTLLYNIHTLEYDFELLSLFNIPKSLLATVKDSNSEFGYCDLFEKDIPITGILGDQQASLFAQCGMESTCIKNTYGTGLFVVAQTGNDIPETSSLINTVAWTIDNTTTYALEGSIFIGGAAIQWLRDELHLLNSAEESAAIAQTIPDNDDLYFVPALTGLGAPHWDPHAKGLLIGITRGTTQAHIIRASLESLAYQTRDVIDEFKKIVPQSSFSTLRVDGGGSNNDFLMQFQSDLLQLQIEKPSISDSTAFGVAGIAGYSCGFWSLEQFFKLRKIKQSYSPKKPLETHYLNWKKAVLRSLNWK